MEPRTRAELTYRSRTFATIGWSMVLLVVLIVGGVALWRITKFT